MAASPRERADAFCRQWGLKAPVILAPMAGIPAPRLSVAVGNAGGMGSVGALFMQPAEITAWFNTVRAASAAPILANLWVAESAPSRDAAREANVRQFLEMWGPPVPPQAGVTSYPDFGAQCAAIIAARPAAVSSIMGLFAPGFVAALRGAGIAWFATVTTLAEARAAEAAGADAIVAQGMEAGGHRGAFDATSAERELVGLFALLPTIADAVQVPVIATGGIADGRGIAAALTLGASAVAIGTGFLRAPEAELPRAWADRLAATPPEGTIVTRAFSGRPGRAIANRYALAAGSADAPPPAPYPVQRGLTAPMRTAAAKANDIDRMQAWSGQAASLASDRPAGETLRRMWSDAEALLR